MIEMLAMMNLRKLGALAILSIPASLILYWWAWSWQCSFAEWSWPVSGNGSWPGDIFALVCLQFLGILSSVVVAGMVTIATDWPIKLWKVANEPWHNDDMDPPETF
jgi:hypothetical protein